VPTGMGCQTNPSPSGQRCMPFCDAAHYEVLCTGQGEPTVPGCEVIPIPTPANVTFYCCPHAGAGADASADAR
jgi:hypothetical protein